MRVPDCCMKAMMSSSRLSGRAGRGGGGPCGRVNGTVMGFSGIGTLEYCAMRTGRETERLPAERPMNEEREVRAEVRAECRGVNTERRDVGRAASGSTGIWGTGGGGGEDEVRVLLRKKREPWRKVSRCRSKRGMCKSYFWCVVSRSSGAV